MASRMNTNWSKILLFTLLGFALGYIVCRLSCGNCHGGGGCHGGMEASCHGGMSMCDHGGTCCSGKDSHCEKAGCDHKMGGACCKGGGHGTSHGEERVKVIVADLEKTGFQGDTTIAIEGGTVSVSRTGDSTLVKVEMTKAEEHHDHTH
jgi:hypothetical protein